MNQGTERTGIAAPDAPAGSDPAEQAIVRRHLEAWRSEGLITPELSATLLTRLARGTSAAAAEAQRGTSVRSLGRGVTLLVNIGGIALAVGLITFLATNWMAMPQPLRVGTLIGLTGGFQLAGFALLRWERVRFPALGLALLAMGCLAFGASIPLLVYLHFGFLAYPPVFLALFCAACFGIAYTCRSRLVLALGLAGLLGWFGMEVGYAWGGYWIYLWKPVHFVAAGVLLVCAGVAHGERRVPEFRNVYLLFGLIVGFSSLLVLSQRDAQAFDEAERFLWMPEAAVIALFLIPAALPAGAAVWLFAGSRGKDLRLFSPPVVLAAAVWAALFVSGLLAMSGVESRYWWMALLTALTLVGGYLGIAWRNKTALNVSVAFLVIDAYTRYFEWFWDPMPKSLFFMLGGVALVAGGIFLERSRRRLVSRNFAVPALGVR